MKLPYTVSDAEFTAGGMPDILTFNDGTPVKTKEDWARRRKEIYDLIIPVEYGGMPPALAPEMTDAEYISGIKENRRFSNSIPTDYSEYIVHISGGKEPLSFKMQVWKPAGEGKFPVILSGDGCWNYIGDEIIHEMIMRGFAVAAFNRCEIARDWNGAQDRGIFKAFPGEYGTLAAWAWSYHRAYDALLKTDFADPARVYITGHSRGGKTVELATATDERIAGCGDNNSGCGGFGCYRVRRNNAETLGKITTVFPYWFAKDFGKWADREAELPFDQHFLAALIAPRPLNVAVAHGDTWANPVGACETYRNAVKIYEFLGAEENYNIVFREGGHGHLVSDWMRFADFIRK